MSTASTSHFTIPAIEDAGKDGYQHGMFYGIQAALEAVAVGFHLSNDRRLAKLLQGEIKLVETVAPGVRIAIEVGSDGFDVRVDWSAIGDVVPERAEAFATELQKAARRASTIRDILRSFDIASSFSPEFLANVAAHGIPTVPA